MELLGYAHEHGCPWDSRTGEEAAENGHVHVLEYAHRNRCPWDAETCNVAAANGRLEVLEWAYSTTGKDCPWNETTTAAAAANGHLEALKYLHKKGCPWDESACDQAAEGEHLACLRYARKQGCPYNPWNQAAKWALEEEEREEISNDAEAEEEDSGKEEEADAASTSNPDDDYNNVNETAEDTAASVFDDGHKPSVDKLQDEEALGALADDTEEGTEAPSSSTTLANEDDLSAELPTRRQILPPIWSLPNFRLSLLHQQTESSSSPPEDAYAADPDDHSNPLDDYCCFGTSNSFSWLFQNKQQQQASRSFLPNK